MSYARFGEGDVYIFGGAVDSGEDPIWYCQWCSLVSRPATFTPDPGSILGVRVDGIEDFTTRSLAALRDHVQAHIAAGDDVPERCTERIAAELPASAGAPEKEEPKR